jgi:peptidoglycan/LPS O-acetylase OafA/YrhL
MTKTAKGEGVVASLGADGVLVRQDDGQWEKRRVLGAPPITPSAIDIAAAMALFVFGPGLALLLWLIGRRRWPLLSRGLAVVVAGWVVTLAATSAVLLVGIGRFPRVTIPMVAVVGAALTTAAAVGTARRPRRQPRPART